ncbi:MAG: GIY-YIG nuclease family protein, partial [Candidatus Paceibacteria bacterium]
MTIEDLKKLKIPDSTGVYLFERGTRVLYVGKATTLSDRVRSYFGKDILKTRGQLIKKMVEEADFVDFVKTDSVLEALIMEANLIKKFQPRYNTKEKDDKSFNYVVITREDFPRVLIVRGKDLVEERYTSRDIKYLFGPFPHGGVFKDAMKIVRKLFPFRDTCNPYSKKPCFNRQIGLCPGVCSGEISKIEYGRTINHIKLFFEGKKKSLIKSLEQEMHSYAKKKKFEKANAMKKTIFALNHIQDVSLIKEELKKPEIPKARPRETSRGQALGTGNFRIEAYDVAHMSGVNTVGVMTVVENGWV